MFKHFWIMALITFSLLIGQIAREAVAEPNQPFNSTTILTPALAWERDYQNGLDQFTDGNYELAEKALYSALVHAREARQAELFPERSCSKLRLPSKERLKLFGSKIKHLATILGEADGKHYEVVGRDPAEEKFLKTADSDPPDERLDKTKQLLARCDNEHAASVRNSLSVFMFVPKWLLACISVISAIFTIFFFLVGSLFSFFQEVFPRTKVVTVWIWSSLFFVVFGLIYYFSYTACVDLDNIDRLENQALKLKQQPNL